MVTVARTNGGRERPSAEAPMAPRIVDGLKRADDRFVALVRQRPLVTLGGALLVGYVLGRIATARS